MRPKRDSIGIWGLKHFLQSTYFQHQINAFAIGSAQANYGPSHLKQMKTISPPVEVGLKYESIVTPIEESRLNLMQTNSALRKTRDLLLPKLISGQLDVEELDIVGI